MPKFLLRIFEKGVSEENCPKFIERILEKITKIRHPKNKKKKTIGLNHLKNFFSNDDEESVLLRYILMKQIRKNLTQEVTEREQNTNKLNYMVAAKVYALRLRNSSLSGRIKSK